jgi:nicotinate-nucleotide adenylyltransferase
LHKTHLIGLFGGTFNPIHFGHLNLALELKEKKNLDEVWFIPSHQSPLRLNEPLVSNVDRLSMLELAIASIPGFKICTEELDRPPPSFTIDTLRSLISKHPDCSFNLLLGEDALLKFQEWKEPLGIIHLAKLCIGSRHKAELIKLLPSLGLNEEVALAIQKNLVSTRQLEISATDIRERLKKRMYCGHLLPSKVLDYIYAHQLYFNALT